jgi:methylmalonyl-CoA mutase cobalamin-binding subunit
MGGILVQIVILMHLLKDCHTPGARFITQVLVFQEFSAGVAGLLLSSG